MVIDSYIKKLSKEILKAGTRHEAVEFCCNKPDFDLIMMDIGIPNMDGFEATRQIQALTRRLS